MTVDKLDNGKPDLGAKNLTFDYTCGDQKGSIVTTGNTAQGVGKDLPVGTECTVELNNSSAFIPHYDYAVPPAQTFTITEDGHEAHFKVDYTLKAAAFAVHKIVEGAPADVVKDKSFFFTYECSIGGGPIAPVGIPDAIEVKEGNSWASPLIFPVGTTCVITEDTSKAQLEGYTLQATELITLELDRQDQPKDFAFTNTYTRDTATFRVTKNVTGVEAKDKPFTFTYTCGDQTGSIITFGDGNPTASKVLVPTGTECTVSEDVKSAAIQGYTHTAPKAQTFTLSTKDEVKELTFTNTYTKVIPPPGDSGKTTTDKTTPGQPLTGKTLAGTGGTTSIIVITSLIVLLLGLGLGLYSRKR